MNDILASHPESRLKVFVLWAPYLQHDSRGTAQRASLYMDDERATHFWDLWRFGTRSYSEQLGLPARDAWDMFAFYKPHLVWKEKIPAPTFWMQNRGLDTGTAYSKEALAEELEVWLD